MSSRKDETLAGDAVLGARAARNAKPQACAPDFEIQPKISGTGLRSEHGWAGRRQDPRAIPQ